MGWLTDSPDDGHRTKVILLFLSVMLLLYFMFMMVIHFLLVDNFEPLVMLILERSSFKFEFYEFSLIRFAFVY